MDDLLHHLRLEIAMDGDDGTPVDRLDTFVQDYYERQAASKPSSTFASTSTYGLQNVDDPFREFVWKQLVTLPEINIAFLRKTETIQTVPTFSHEAEEGTPIGNENNVNDAELSIREQGKFNLKNKQQIKADRKDKGKKGRDARLTGDSWEFSNLTKDEISNSSRQNLVEKYGSESLRVAVTSETSYVALTGSHERRGKLTSLSYQVLQAIARGRENGKTVIELGKEFDHDQKSLFHFVKNLVDMNLVVKIRVLDSHSQTSRCIHRHYLETSQHWATWMTKDPEDFSKVNGGDDEDDEGEAKISELSILTIAHLNSNEPLIRSRIVIALRNSPENIVSHLQLASAMGFQFRLEQLDRRRLNRIVVTMANQGIIEKVGVARPGAKGLLGCIRLVERDKEDHSEALGLKGDDKEDLQRPNLLVTVAIERQMLDLLVEAGAQGLTIREIRVALGDVNRRIIETILTRYEKTIDPPHLCDFRIQSILETAGREKRLRWFTIAGYHERCRLDGLHDLPDQRDFSHPELAGEFSVLESTGFYETPAAFEAFASTMNTSSRDLKRTAKIGRPLGKSKRSRDIAAVERAIHEGKATQEDLEALKAQPVRKRGRPLSSSVAQKRVRVGSDVEAGAQLLDGQYSKAKKGRKRKVIEGSVDHEAQVNIVKKARKKRKDNKIKGAHGGDVQAVTSGDSNTEENVSKDGQAGSDNGTGPLGTKKKKMRMPEPPGPNGTLPPLPIRGRPRKYPPGITKVQRAKLLAERRAAGLDLPGILTSLDNPADSSAAVFQSEMNGVSYEKGGNAIGEDGFAASSAKTVSPPPLATKFSPESSLLQFGDGAEPQVATAQTPQAEIVEKKRGRPRKNPLSAPPASTASPDQGKGQAPDTGLSKKEATDDTLRKRGRARKNAQAKTQLAMDGDVTLDVNNNLPEPNTILGQSLPGQHPEVDESMPQALAIIREPPNLVLPVTSPENLENVMLAEDDQVIIQNAGEMARSPSSTTNGPRSVKSTLIEEIANLLRSAPHPLLPSGQESVIEAPEADGYGNASAAAASKNTDTEVVDALSQGMLCDDTVLGHTSRDDEVEEPRNRRKEADSLRQNNELQALLSSRHNLDEQDVTIVDEPSVAVVSTRLASAAAVKASPRSHDVDSASRIDGMSPSTESIEATWRPNKELPKAGRLPASGDTLRYAILSTAQPVMGQESKPVKKAIRVMTKLPERRNYSMHVHENDFFAVLKEVGGISEEGIVFLKLWQDYKKKRNGIEPPMLDRRTLATILNGLERRGLVTRTNLQVQSVNGNFVQKPVMFLADIDLDSQQMRDYSTILQGRLQEMGATKNWLQGRKIVDESNSFTSYGPKGRRERRLPTAGTEPHDFFASEWRIVAQSYGWQYGLFARARTLHQYLVGSINDDNDSAFIVSSSPVTRLFSSSYVLLDTPLSVYLRIAACISYNGDLDLFLAQNDASTIPIRDLPVSISSVFLAGKNKSMNRFPQLFEILTALHLLIPMEQVEEPTDVVVYSGIEREPRYFRPRATKGASYWLLANRAPVYDSGQMKPDAQVLLGDLPIADQADGTNYWKFIEKISLRQGVPPALPRTDIGYSAVWEASGPLKHSIRTQARWYSDYLLLNPQKEYLKRTLLKRDDNESILEDTESMQKLSFNICAPVQVVREYVEMTLDKLSSERHTKVRSQRFARMHRRSRATSDESDFTTRSDGQDFPISRRSNPNSQKKSTGKSQSTAEILARKAKQATRDLQITWDGLLGRFLAEHGEQALLLDAEQLSYVHEWFMGGEMNAGILKEHLDTMLADAQPQRLLPVRPLPMTAQRSNGNPSAFHHKSGRSRKRLDPRSYEYEIAEGNDREQLEEVSEDEGGPVLPVMPPGEAVAAKSSELSLKHISTVVATEGQKRTAAHGWNEAEDEQLRDFFVILQARASHLRQKLTIEPCKPYYPGCSGKLLLDRLRRLVQLNEEAPYLDALQDAWTTIWLKARGKPRLPDLFPESLTDFNISVHRSYLCAKIDKSSIRFQAMISQSSPESSFIQLPAEPTEFFSSYLLTNSNSLPDADNSRSWDYLWSTTTTAQKVKDYHYRPFFTAYNIPNARTGLSSTTRVAMFKEKHPFKALLPETTLRDAAAFEKRLVADVETEWPIIAEDGDMLAIAHLFSDDMLKLSIDTSVTLEGRPYTDYRTRKIDDESFENSVTIGLSHAYTPC